MPEADGTRKKVDPPKRTMDKNVLRCYVRVWCKSRFVFIFGLSRFVIIDLYGCHSKN